MNFNEQDFLCHYGIKGMKWGIRRYENPDGTLTPEGLKRYGSKKGIKKAIKKEMKKSDALSDAVLARREAVAYANKLSEKENAKYEKKRKEKYRIRSEAAKRNVEFQKKQLEDAENLRKEHYNKLVEEFGKTAVSEISAKDDEMRRLQNLGNQAALASSGIYVESLRDIGVRYARSDMKKMTKQVKKEAGAQSKRRYSKKEKEQIRAEFVKLRDKASKNSNRPSHERVADSWKEAHDAIEQKYGKEIADEMYKTKASYFLFKRNLL